MNLECISITFIINLLLYTYSAEILLPPTSKEENHQSQRTEVGPPSQLMLCDCGDVEWIIGRYREKSEITYCRIAKSPIKSRVHRAIFK